MRPRPEKKYKEPRTPKRRRVSDIVYLMTILTAFETIGIAMLVFPRSTESITEKRELKKFPGAFRGKLVQRGIHRGNIRVVQRYGSRPRRGDEPVDPAP